MQYTTAVFNRLFVTASNKEAEVTTTSVPFKDMLKAIDVWLSPVVSVIAIAGTLFTPVVIYLCTKCIRKKKLEAVTNMDNEENTLLAERFQQQMAEFRLRNPQAEADYNEETRFEFEVLNKNHEQEQTELIANQTRRRTKTGSIKLKRICSLCLYISWCFWVAAIAIFFTFKLVAFGNVFAALIILSFIFVILLPIFVLWESCFSAEKNYLSNLDSLQFSTQAIESIRRTQPFVGMEAVCYHYETRTRLVAYSDGRGNIRTRMETYQEKVVTNTFKEEFVYGFWRDNSETILQSIRSNGVTRIKMKLSIIFGDPGTRTAFYIQYFNFQNEHRGKDTFVDYKELFEVEGFRSRLCAFTDLNSKPWWIGIHCYMIASIFTLTWPYRFFFNRAAGRTEYNVNKAVYFNRPVGAVDMSGFNIYAMPPSLNPSGGVIVNDAHSPPPPSNPQGRGIVNGAKSPNIPPPCPPRGRINGACNEAVELKNLPGNSKDMVVPLQRGYSLMPKY